MECTTCENRCEINDGGTGVCGMYTVRQGFLVEKYPDSYLVVVPAEVESMPMLHFRPGSKFLQVCTVGCNLRCSGCVSWILTESVGSIESGLHRMTPGEVVARAESEGCPGIMFCFNEPSVSFPTFKRVAALARKKNLLVGCATNGYMTEAAFDDLLRHIDFVNIGIKGCTEETYRSFGASSPAPIFRNLKASLDSGVFTEVAAVYVKGREDEVRETAKLIATYSPDIPFQVMRFVPLAGADPADEPSIGEAEALCDDLRKHLRYVYLFNSPGTPYLNTYCPECGEIVVRRGFNGPMCAHVSDFRDDGVCRCGFRLPFVGPFQRESGAQVLGYFGGYKTIMSLESIQGILAFLGEREPSVVASVLQKILETNFIEGLYERTKRVDSYLDTVDYYAQLAGRTAEARELRIYIEGTIAAIEAGVRECRRPRVYFSLGHPLIAIFGDKFECNLVEIAGGHCVNKDLDRDDLPGMTIAPEALIRLDPEIILVSSAVGYPVADFYAFCKANGLGEIAAIKGGRVYTMHPYPTAGRPDWILGLMRIAAIIHPETFTFDMESLAREFYARFLGVRLSSVEQNRSITHPTILDGMKQAAAAT
jgi:pyruvate-formate lyase-activating enzyme